MKGPGGEQKSHIQVPLGNLIDKSREFKYKFRNEAPIKENVR